MIQIFYDENQGLHISVDDGGIIVDSSEATSEAHVKFDDGSVVQIDAGSSLSAQADTGKNSKNVEIKSGTAQITTEAGDEMALVVGESVNVSQSGRILKNPLTVMSPQKELRLLNTSNSDFTDINFEWKNEYESPVIIQTSRLKNFSKLESDDFIETGTSYTLKAPNDTLYWRVFTMYTIDSPVTGKIIIDNDTQMQLVSPAAGTSYRYYTEVPRIKFRWTGNENAAHYKIAISSTSDMKSILTEKEVQETFVTIDSIKEGTWYWQVTPYYAMNNIGYSGGSDIGSFTVTHADTHKPPELLLPSPNKNIARKDGEEPAMLFSWKSDLPQAKHTLLIATDELFKNLIYSSDTNGTRYTCSLDANTFDEGSYYWKIVREASGDDEQSESNARVFSISRYIPAENKLLYPQTDFTAEIEQLPTTQFMWKVADDYKNLKTVFQISSSQDFKSVLEEKNPDTPFVNGIKLQQGNYWWRIASRTEDGELVGVTEARKLTILKELSAPKILLPAFGQEVVVGTSQPVGISWADVAEADSYSIKVLDDDGNIIAQRRTEKETSVQVPLIPGSYTVAVQSQLSGRQSVSTSVKFSVRGPESIILDLPEDGKEIAGLTALRQPTYFAWQIGKDEASQYTFILQKEQGKGKYVQVDSISGSGHGVSVRRIQEGKYKWKVQGRTAAGLPLDSQEFTFTVTKVPELAKANLIEPEPSLVMGPAYLREHRTIVFRWQSVRDANAYDFTLVKKTSRGEEILLSKTKIEETQVRLSDLTVLDVGNFEWRVRAYCYARDGYEEQQSPIASQTFTIKFDAPKKVEALDPGVLYGE